MKNIIKQTIKTFLLPKNECIPDDVLISFYENKLTPDQRSKVVDHLESCSKCTILWKELDLFMNEPLRTIPQEFKSDTLKKIIQPQKLTEPKMKNLSFLAYAASFIAVMLTGFTLYTQSQLAQTKHELTQQMNKLEMLKQDNSILTKDIESIQQSMTENHKLIDQAKNPISHVPIFDLFPEDEYRRDSATRTALKIKHEENKPLHFILNTTGAIDKPCTIALIDSTKKVLWSSEVPAIINGTESILIPANFLAPGSYTIEVKSSSSSRLIATYSFIYE